MNRLHERMGLPPGNYTLLAIEMQDWGSSITADIVYQTHDTTRHFRLRFEECRGIQWYVQRSNREIRELEQAQLISHDLGKGHYERTARLASTLAEVIISYERLKIDLVTT